jgi:DNA mismatch repair protein MutH
MPNNSDLTDFEDGELKTNKADSNGKPRETMFITQISEDFDSLFFNDTVENRLLAKISNLLYLPVCKNSKEPNDWYFLPAYHINCKENRDLFQQFHDDFETIKAKILHDLENSSDKFIHTSKSVKSLLFGMSKSCCKNCPVLPLLIVKLVKSS